MFGWIGQSCVVAWGSRGRHGSLFDTEGTEDAEITEKRPGSPAEDKTFVNLAALAAFVLKRSPPVTLPR